MRHIVIGWSMERTRYSHLTYQRTVVRSGWYSLLLLLYLSPKVILVVIFSPATSFEVKITENHCILAHFFQFAHFG
jgi:hypothetical protein